MWHDSLMCDMIWLWCKRRYYVTWLTISFGVSFDLNLQSQSYWSRFNGTWQKRTRELDYWLRFEIEEMTLHMQQDVLCDVTHWYDSFMCDMTHWFIRLIHMWHDSLIWLIDMWHDSLICDTIEMWCRRRYYVTWLIDMTHSYVTWLIDMTHWYVTQLSCDARGGTMWHDVLRGSRAASDQAVAPIAWVFFTCDMTRCHSHVPWLGAIHMWHDSVPFTCAMTRSYMWHDSFICDTCKGGATRVVRPKVMWYDSFICDMTHSYVTCVFYDNICDMTHSRETCLMHMTYNSFTCNANDTQLIAMRMTYNWHTTHSLIDTTHSYVTWLIDMTHSYVTYVTTHCDACDIQLTYNTLPCILTYNAYEGVMAHVSHMKESWHMCCIWRSHGTCCIDIQHTAMHIDVQLIAMHMTSNSFTCDVTHSYATPAKGELRGWCVQGRCCHALPSLRYCALPLCCGMSCRLAALCDMTRLIYAWYDSFECVTGIEVW